MASSKSLSSAWGLPAPLWPQGRNLQHSHLAAVTQKHSFPLLPPSLNYFNSSWAPSVRLETCLAVGMKNESAKSFLAVSATGSEKPAWSVLTLLLPGLPAATAHPCSLGNHQPRSPPAESTALWAAGKHSTLEPDTAKLPHVLSLAILNTQGITREYLWADGQEDFNTFL